MLGVAVRNKSMAKVKGLTPLDAEWVRGYIATVICNILRANT